MNEVDSVNGGKMRIDQGLYLIGGIAGVCAVIPGLKDAAAFGAGVDFGGQFVLAWANW